LHFHAVPLPRIGGQRAALFGFLNDYTGPLLPLHKFITIAALGTGAAQLIFIFNPDIQPL